MKLQTKNTLRIFWQHTIRYKWRFFMLVFFDLAAIIAAMYYPFLYKELFDLLEQGTSFLGEIRTVIIWIALVSAAVWLSKTLVYLAQDLLEPHVMRDLYNTCFRYLHKHSYEFFSNNFSGSLVKKMARYEDAYEDVIVQLLIYIGPAVLKVLLVIAILSTKFWFLAMLVAVWSVIYVTLNYWFTLFKVRFDFMRAKFDSQISGFVSDTVSNNINLKLFSSFKKENKSFEKLSLEHLRFRQKSWMLGTLSHFIQNGLMVALEVLMLIFAAKLWSEGALTLGDFAFIQAYLFQIFDSLMDLGYNIRRTYEAFAEAEEMTDILMTPHEIKDQGKAKRLKVPKGEIEFRNLSFSYNGQEKIFDQFNLNVRAGERIAIVGSSGSGKSTILKLLLRFYDLQKGKIIVDGQDISTVTQDSLREAIAFVPQEPILFHRSLYENIAYARPEASEKEVMEAARLAHCHEFIAKLPHKYKTLVGERGIKLSGGERQRVAIARAMLKNAPILILDEATSSLDSESEHFIQDSLKQLMKGRTTLVVAHRLSTIMQMDRILVLENGVIIEEGKHKDLLEENEGRYRKLWKIQIGGV